MERGGVARIFLPKRKCGEQGGVAIDIYLARTFSSEREYRERGGVARTFLSERECRAVSVARIFSSERECRERCKDFFI